MRVKEIREQRKRNIQGHPTASLQELETDRKDHSPVTNGEACTVTFSALIPSGQVNRPCGRTPALCIPVDAISAPAAMNPSNVIHRLSVGARLRIVVSSPTAMRQWRVSEGMHCCFDDLDPVLKGCLRSATMKVSGAVYTAIFSVSLSRSRVAPGGERGPASNGEYAVRDVPLQLNRAIYAAHDACASHNSNEGVFDIHKYGLRFELMCTFAVPDTNHNHQDEMPLTQELILAFPYEGRASSRYASDLFSHSDYFRALFRMRNPDHPSFRLHQTENTSYEDSVRWRLDDRPIRDARMELQDTDIDSDDDSEELRLTTSFQPCSTAFTHRQVLIVLHSCYKTWMAVLDWVRTKRTTFRSVRSAFGRAKKKCSPRSVYRVAYILGLHELCTLALRSYEECISHKNFMKEIMHPVTLRWPGMKAAVWSWGDDYALATDQSAARAALLGEDVAAEEAADWQEDARRAKRSADEMLLDEFLALDGSDSSQTSKAMSGT